MAVYSICFSLFFPWNIRVFCSVCSQWLLSTWFDNSSENRVSGAAQLKCSRVWKGVRIRYAPDCMDDWQRSLQLFRQMLWMWNLWDSKFETQNNRWIYYQNFQLTRSQVNGPSVSFHKEIGGSEPPRMIVSSVRPSGQSVSKFISNCKEQWRQASAAWSRLRPGALILIDIYPDVSDIQDPVAMLNKLPRKTNRFLNSPVKWPFVYQSHALII